MKISYKWLQGYFEEKLPTPEKLFDLITFSFAEVESMAKTSSPKEDVRPTESVSQIQSREKMGDDTVFDIKVLPDRACYALSHRGVAYEVAAITGFKRKVFDWPKPVVSKTRPLSVKIEAPELCARYMARVIEDITPKDNPWVGEHLKAIGQRSINPIVDGANIVMFDMSQPLHAFDADKVSGDIVVRRAKVGEHITTLDNREVALDNEVLVIADEKGPLALAGIKGGTKAAVTAATKNLILESASFDPSYIRKTSERLGIKTDASKRFENRFSSDLAATGMADFTALLFEMDKNLKAGEIIDVYPKPVQALKIETSTEYLTHKLGLELAEAEVLAVAKRLEFEVTKKGKDLIFTPPVFRVDVAIREDVAEEIGRIVGYDKIPATPLPKYSGKFSVQKSFYYEHKVREILVGLGFSEVMTSSFAVKGEVPIAKPLAEDKAFLRTTLVDNLSASVALNMHNIDLLGLNEIKIFEIGKIFSRKGETTSLGILVRFKHGVKNSELLVETLLETIRETLEGQLKISIHEKPVKGILEIDLDTALANLPEPKAWDLKPFKFSDKKFEAISVYPFVVRDVAVFVPAEVSSGEVLAIIKKEAGTLLVKETLFDEFKKADKTSYAFRLVFESFERTLLDSEINVIMEKITIALNSNSGWQVR